MSLLTISQQLQTATAYETVYYYDQNSINIRKYHLLFKGIDFDINGDVHYRFNIGRDARIHPLAGLNLAKFNGNSTLDIGINLGIFASMPIQDRLQLYLEPKVILGGQSSFAISVGVMI